MEIQVINKSDLQSLLEDFIMPKMENLYTSKHSSPAEEYLTRDEVCKLLKINLTTLWRWTKEKAFAPSYEVGNRVYYKRSEIESYLEQNKAV